MDLEVSVNVCMHVSIVSVFQSVVRPDPLQGSIFTPMMVFNEWLACQTGHGWMTAA